MPKRIMQSGQKNKVMEDFEKFMQENYKGYNFISIPNEAFAPGVILNYDERIVDNIQRIFPSASPLKWSKKAVIASMPIQVVSGERKLDLGVSLLGLFSLKAGLGSKYTVSFEFNEVTEMVFDVLNGGIYENEIRTLILNLEYSDHDAWEDIIDEHLVMEVLIVKSVTVEFKRDGKSVSDFEIEQIKNEIGINGSYTWDETGKMVLNSVQNYPFAVMDFQINKLV